MQQSAVRVLYKDIMVSESCVRRLVDAPHCIDLKIVQGHPAIRPNNPTTDLEPIGLHNHLRPTFGKPHPEFNHVPHGR